MSRLKTQGQSQEKQLKGGLSRNILSMHMTSCLPLGKLTFFLISQTLFFHFIFLFTIILYLLKFLSKDLTFEISSSPVRTKPISVQLSICKLI